MVEPVKPAELPLEPSGVAPVVPEPAAALPVIPAVDAPTKAEVPATPEKVAAAGAEPVVEAPKLEPGLLEKFDTKEAEKAAKIESDRLAAAEKTKPAIDAKAEAKPDEKKDDKKAAAAEKPKDEKKVEAKPADGKLAEPAKPEAVEYKYTLPETLKMDDTLKGKVHGALDAFRANPVEGAQALIDLHAETMAEFVKNYQAEALRNQFKVFNQTKADQEKLALSDTEIGGSGHDTAMGAIARARDAAISSAKPGSPRYIAERAEFEQFLETTGAGSFRAFLRLMHNASRYIDEPQANELPAEIKPTKTNGKAPKSGLYNHASSANMERT